MLNAGNLRGSSFCLRFALLYLLITGASSFLRCELRLRPP